MARDRKGLIFSAADIFVRRCTSTFHFHVQRAGAPGHSSVFECSMRCVLLFNFLQLAAAAQTRLFVVFSGAPDLAHSHTELRLRTGGCTEMNSTVFAHSDGGVGECCSCGQNVQATSSLADLCPPSGTFRVFAELLGRCANVVSRG